MSIKQGIYKSIVKLLYPTFSPRLNVGLGFYIQLGIKQKILGHNRSISWPVHFTSIVKGVDNIKRSSLTSAPGSAPGCYIDGRNGIIIEENVLIGPNVSIISMNHDANNYNEYKHSLPITLKKNSWLASNCIILPGIELGEHTIVAAGAVVTKSFPDGNQVIGGNPAKVIKKLNNYITI